MMEKPAFSDIRLNLFCMCQAYYLDEKTKNDLLPKFFNDSRSISSDPNIKNIKNYLEPSYTVSFTQDNIDVISDFTLFFNPLHVKKEIDTLIKMINVTPEIDAYLKFRLERAAGYEEKRIENDLDTLLLSIRIDSSDRNFSGQLINDVWRNKKVMSFFELQEKYLLKNIRGYLCSRLIFDEKYRVIGDILPRPLQLPKEVESQVGETIINGFILEFKDSNIGLEKLDVIKKRIDWNLYYRFKFLIDDFRDGHKKGLDLLLSISELFMEE